MEPARHPGASRHLAVHPLSGRSRRLHARRLRQPPAGAVPDKRLAHAGAVHARPSDFYPGARGQQAREDDQQVLGGGPPILSTERSDFGDQGNVHWSLTTKVPLRDAHGRITGIVGISHDITRRKLAEEELKRHTAAMEADVRMACRVQEAFLPRTYPIFPRGVPPEASTLRFAHRYIRATPLGGDFAHILPLSDSRCGVLICDV